MVLLTAGGGTDVAGAPTRVEGGPTTRKRSTRLTAEVRREQIIDAAIELFAQNGYRSSGVIALAQRVGLTHSGLIHHFGTKENLLLAVVARRDRRMGEGKPESFTTGRQWLDSLLSDARSNAADPVPVRLYHVLINENLDAGSPLHEFFTARYQRARDSMVRGLEAGVATEEFVDDLAHRQLADEVLATIIGLERQFLLEPDSFDLVGAMTRYLDGLAARIAAPQGE